MPGARRPRGDGAARHGRHGRQPRQRGHHRRLHHLEVRPILRAARRALVDPALSGTLAGEARRAAWTSWPPVRSASGAWLSRSWPPTSPWSDSRWPSWPSRPGWSARSSATRTWAMHATPRSRPSASPYGSDCSASSRGPWFALAPVVGRASAAGVAGVVMLLAFVSRQLRALRAGVRGHRQPLLALLDLRSRPAGGTVRLALARARRARRGSPAGGGRRTLRPP